MEIKSIDAFDLYGDGTLVIKTNVDELRKDFRFAWYILKEQEVIFKSPYQANPFISYQLKAPGKYQIKAFVLDKQKNRLDLKTTFLANNDTSPLLVEKGKEVLGIAPVSEWISGSFWRLSVLGNVPQGATYAWYLYRGEEEIPFHKEMYSDRTEYVHKFDALGVYRFRVFILSQGIKYSVFSENFEVSQG